MALKALNCPQCGAHLELDDNREIGFCEFCGAKVQIREIIEVRHSGQVKIDNSEQQQNYKILAERAFLSKNYNEAANFYTQALVYNPNDVVCLYRRAISKIYCTYKGDVKYSEFQNEMRLAYSYINNDNNLEIQINNELMNLYNFLCMEMTQKLSIYPNADACSRQLNTWIRFLNLASCIIAKFSKENYKESALNSVLSFCDSEPYIVLKYRAVIRNQNGTFNVTNNYPTSQGVINTFKQFRSEFSRTYNNLPKNALEMNSLNAKKNQIEEEIKSEKIKINNLKSRKDKTPNPDRKEPNYVRTIIFLIVSHLPWILCVFVEIIAIIVLLFAEPNSSFYTFTATLVSFVLFLLFVFILLAITLTAVIIVVSKSNTRKFWLSRNYIDEKSSADIIYNSKIRIIKDEEELKKVYDQIAKLQSRLK